MTDLDVIAEARRLPVLWAGREPVYGLLRLAGFEPEHAKRAALSVPSLHDPEWIDLTTHGAEAHEEARRARREAVLAGTVPGSPEEAAALAELEGREKASSSGDVLPISPA